MVEGTSFSNNRPSIQVMVAPQLQISNLHVAQVVPDFKVTNSSANYDLVLGKSTSVQFTVTLTDVDGASAVKTISLIVPPRDDYDDDEKREIFSGIETIMGSQGRGGRH